MRWPLRMLASALLVLASAAPVACHMPSRVPPIDLAVHARTPFRPAASGALASVADTTVLESLLGDGLSPQDGASIALEKITNGQDADLPPGPFVAVGDTVVWTYLVTNTGTITLNSIAVVDDEDVPLWCPETTLPPGQAMECAANPPTGGAVAGQQGGAATVYGTPEDGSPTVSASDPSHYFGATTSIALDKLTLGMDADSPPGPYVPVGETVTWDYLVTNTSNVTLTLVVTDDQGISVNCPSPILAPYEAMPCEGSGTAVLGSYANTGMAMGTPPDGLADVSAEDASHYYGASLSLGLDTLTNGQDADAAPGLYVTAGEAVTWTYLVTNTSNVTLTHVVVTDDQGIPVACPKGTLAPFEAMACETTGIAAEGPYTRTGTAEGRPPGGLPNVNASDPSHYYGVAASLSLAKYTNGHDVDGPPGPFAVVGETVTWAYRVTNTGNITLTQIAITDDQGVDVVCPQTTLSSGGSMVCDGTDVAILGEYSNLATVTGLPPVGPVPSATDRSYYRGVLVLYELDLPLILR